MVYETLGFYIPIISTEGGPVVGWGDDDRYAKVNPTTQAEWQMAIVRFMQDEAPPWYFTVCTWLLASKPLGDFNPTWDQMSWYTHAWDLQFGLDGQLPIVQMLKDTPAQIRHELRPSGDAAAVTGVVRGRDHAPLAGVTLELHDAGGATVARAISDEQGRFQLVAPSGVYDVFIPWWGYAAHDITLTPADVDTLQMDDIDPPGHYEITGQVLDEDGLIQPQTEVRIQRNGIVHQVVETDAQGRFIFRPALAGLYALVTQGASAEVAVTPDRPTAHHDLVRASVATMRYVVVEKRLLPPEETGNRDLFYGRVLDARGQGLNGITLEMRWENAAPGTRFPRTVTGSDPFKPDGYYEFFHTQGLFMIQVVQGDYESEIADGLETAHVPGREGEHITYEVNFQLKPVGDAGNHSVVRGSVPGGRMGQVVILWKDGQKLAEQELNHARTFAFEHLEPGVYDVELAGIGLMATDLHLDGSNEISLTFPLLGAMVGRVQGARAGRTTIKLISETYGFIRHGELTQDGQYRFTNLPPGHYRIELDDDILSGLESDGQGVVEAPLLRVGMGSEPRQSQIEGEVHDAAGNPIPHVSVHLRTLGETLATTQSDDSGHYRFTDLSPGVYAIAVGEVNVASDIVLDGTNRVTVDILYAPTAQAVPKRLDRYYLLLMRNAELTPALVRLVQAWLRTQPPGPVGFSLAEAQFAQTVVLIGDGIPASAVALLKDAQCDIIDLRGDLLDLAQRLQPSSQEMDHA